MEAAGLAQRRPSARRDVDAMLVDQRHERRHVARVHLEIDVDEAGDTARRGAEARLERGAAPPVRVVEDRAHSAIAVAQLGDHAARAVAAHVVDEDDLPRPVRALEHFDQSATLRRRWLASS